MAGIRPPERKDRELAKRKGKKRYYRLDVRERRPIERGLDRRESCRSMARGLGRSASTVHDELVRNRVVTRGPGKGDNVEGTDGPPYRKLTLSMIREYQAKRILPIA